MLSFKCPIRYKCYRNSCTFQNRNISGKELTLVQLLRVMDRLTLLNSLEPMEVREAAKFPCYDIGRGPHSWHSYFSGYKLTRALPSGPQDL